LGGLVKRALTPTTMSRKDTMKTRARYDSGHCAGPGKQARRFVENPQKPLIKKREIEKVNHVRGGGPRDRLALTHRKALKLGPKRWKQPS